MRLKEQNKLIQEARLAKFYMNKIWPLQRKFVSKQLYARCTACILNEKAAKINSRSGLCQYCEAKQTDHKSKVDWPSLKPELDSIIQKTIKGHKSKDYHALLLFSGGKDSCLMLRRVQQQFPGLRILCLSVDNTFMSPFAKQNIEVSIARLGASHIWVRLSKDFCEKMFRFILQRNESNDPMGLVDFFDGELISDVARTVAYRFDIPLILMGLSAEQIERILKLNSYERPYDQEYLARKKVANIDLDDVFEEREQFWWWQGANESKAPARFIFPLATWNLSEEQIISEVNDSGILEGAFLDPVLTNHDMIIPMIVSEYVKHGYFTYEAEFADMVRRNRAKRSDWINVFEFLEYATKTGRMLPPNFDRSLARIGLSRKDLGVPD